MGKAPLCVIHIRTLRDKLINTKKTTFMTDYLVSICTTADQLLKVGVVVPESDMFAFILDGLDHLHV